MALTCSILGTYYILSTQDSPLIFVVFFGALSVQAIGFYTISCDQLFDIPGRLESYKRNCMQMLNGMEASLMNARERKLRKYEIQALPKRVGLKDGGFRMLESVTTLLFIDFYLNTVISMLLL